MEHVSVIELVKEVRVTIDENRNESSYLVSETENMELNEIIRSKLLDAVRAVSEDAPISMLEATPMEIPEAAQYTQTDGSGYVVLPPDFLRLLYFKMSSWRTGVHGAAEENSSVAMMQKNLFTRGTPLKPVCVLSHDLSGKRTLGYYSAGYENNGKYRSRDHRIDRALYLPIPAIVKEKEGEISVEYISFGGVLRPSIVNYCAGLSLVSRGDVKLAESFFNLAKSYFK